MVANSQSYIRAYDKYFLGTYTGVTKEDVIKKWSRWTKPMGTKMFILHRARGVLSAVGELGFNLTFSKGQEWPEIFF